MIKFLRAHKDLIQIVISVVVAVTSGIAMFGHQARLVHIIGLTAGAAGAGKVLGEYLERRRTRRIYNNAQ
jgi:hypothetical protein